MKPNLCEYFFVSENFEMCNFFCSPTERILIELKSLESIGNLNSWSDSRDKNLARVSMKASYQRSSADCKTSCRLLSLRTRVWYHPTAQLPNALSAAHEKIYRTLDLVSTSFLPCVREDIRLYLIGWKFRRGFLSQKMIDDKILLCFDTEFNIYPTV